MRYSILDSSFSLSKQSGRGMSSVYLEWEIKRHGKKEAPVDDADCLLVTCQSTESVPFLKSLKNKYPQKKIVVGGSASTSPYSLGKYCDVVCVGDGQKFLSVLFGEGIDQAKKLSNAWVDGENRSVDIDFGFPWDMPPIQAEDGAFRVWCGRGCKKKCQFCQTGWAYRYQENPHPKSVVHTARNILGKKLRVAYLSNDLMQHSFYSQLPPTMHGSYSVDFLKKRGLPPARQIRLGVEGVSERLRKNVSKPIKNNDLIACTSWLNKNKKSVRWFMIAGLPGEKREDWDDLKATLQQWKATTLKGVLALSFTAFCPDPATPLSIEQLDDGYWDNFNNFTEWFFAGKGWSNRIKIMKPQNPQNRMIKAIRSMGLTEKQLRDGGHFSPNWERLNYPYKSAIEQKMKHRAIELKEQN